MLIVEYHIEEVIYSMGKSSYLSLTPEPPLRSIHSDKVDLTTFSPPGTGKTYVLPSFHSQSLTKVFNSSLTFALAGVFGLDIHVVSLLEPTLTEEELGMLFTNLPARCIILLEDIDTAGLIRNDPAADKAKEGKPEDGGGELNVVNLTMALKKANEQSEEEKRKGISLSGLLNIIDGMYISYRSWSFPPPSILRTHRPSSHYAITT